jgi:uncharacterized caspase-like protein
MRNSRVRILFLAHLMLLWTVVPGTSKENRIALVIGVSKYQHFEQLKNTVSDANLLAEKLRSVGFQVDLRADVSKDGLNQALREFGRRIEAGGPDTVALFYYAGHGVQDDKQVNYLIPASADLKSVVDLPVEALPLDTILRMMEEAHPRVAFAIVDACRDNPLPASSRRGAKRGLALEDERRGQLIAFSTEPGKTALDGEGDHSPFAEALAELIGVPGLEATALFRQVSKRVLDVTNQEQFPWVTQRLTEDFYFLPGAPAEVSSLPKASPPAPPGNAGTPATSSVDTGEIEYGKAVIDNTASAYETWLRSFPSHPRQPSVVKLLQRLREEELWQRAKASSSPAESLATLDRLLISYPDGVYAEKARERQAALRAPEAGPKAENPHGGATEALRVQRHAGMDAPGNDRGSWIREVESVDDCESICLADPGCAGYTYNIRKSTCIPKNFIGPLSQHPEFPVTGVVLARTEQIQPSGMALSPRVIRHAGMDAPGNDRGSWIRDVETVGDCESICLADPGCAGYTYNIRKSTCIPKNFIGPLMKHNEKPVTGVVLARAGGNSPVVTTSVAPVSPAPLSAEEIEVADRLTHNFQQRYQLKGMPGINESIAVCYDQVPKVKTGASAVLYCVALDFLASQVPSSPTLAKLDPSLKFNQVQNAYARAASIMNRMNIQDSEFTLSRAKAVANQAAMKITEVQQASAAPPRRGLTKRTHAR